MTQGKQHISEVDFKRYLNNEMTNAERNAFEKALQKNAFEAEALEGFEQIPAPNFEKELQELKLKIHPRKKTKRLPYFAAAATILLLVTAGVIWIQLEQQNPLTKTSEAKVESAVSEEKPKEPVNFSEQEEQATPQAKQMQLGVEKSTAKKQSTATPKSGKTTPVVAESEQEIEEDFSGLETIEMADEKIEQAKEEPTKSVAFAAPIKQRRNVLQTINTENKIVSGRVISADDNMPIAGATLMEKGTNNGIVTDINGQFQLLLENDSSPTVVASFIGMETQEFQPTQDSNIVRLNADQLALNEVVVIGYGTQRKKTLTGSTTIVNAKKNAKPVPHGGIKAFKNYIKDTATLPSEYAQDKIQLKIKILLNNKGEVDSINYKGQHTELFKKAQEIIHEGPSWNPKIENGENVSSEVNMKIVFRKKDF